MGYFGNSRKMDAFSSNIFRSQAPQGKKIKEVYSSLESLCHAWASENVPRGRSGGSMFFENGIIYSYGHHYAAAKIHTNKAGEKLVLINSVDYSTSTQNHLSEIRSSVSHLSRMRVPDVSPENKEQHEANIEHLSNLMADATEDLLLMRGYRHSETVLAYVFDVLSYCKFFGLKVPFSVDGSEYEILEELEKARGLKTAKRDAARKEREALKEAQLKEQCKDALAKLEAGFPLALEQWRKNEITTRQLRDSMSLRVTIPAPFGRTKGHTISIKKSELAYLRVVGSKVETSQGADVPLSHAVRLLNKIEAGLAKAGERVGHYALASVSPLNKEPVIVTIGCHKIDLKEAQSVLKGIQVLELVGNDEVSE